MALGIGGALYQKIEFHYFIKKSMKQIKFENLSCALQGEIKK